MLIFKYYNRDSIIDPYYIINYNKIIKEVLE
jgi:hypothetical protein